MKLRGLYAIVDLEALDGRGLALEPFAEALLTAGPAALQLRDKRGGAGATLAALRRLAPLARRAGVPLVANDRPDLAALAGADAVHLGQTDLPADEVARGWPGLGVGLSTHSDAELEQALAMADLAYVAIGPIFETQSKTGPEGPAPIVGLARLAGRARRARARRPDLPLVAIGGIDWQRLPQVGALVDAVAVIGALLPPPGEHAPYRWVEETARAWVHQI